MEEKPPEVFGRGTIASRYQAVTASSFLPPSSLQVVRLQLAQYLMSNATTRLVAVISCCLVVLLLTRPKHLRAIKVSSLASSPSARLFIVIYITAVPSSTVAAPATNHKIFLSMGEKPPDKFGRGSNASRNQGTIRHSFIPSQQCLERAFNDTSTIPSFAVHLFIVINSVSGIPTAESRSSLRYYIFWMREHVGPTIQLELVRHNALIMNYNCINSTQSSSFQNNICRKNSMIPTINAAETTFLGPPILCTIMPPFTVTSSTTSTCLFGLGDENDITGMANTSTQAMNYHQQNTSQSLPDCYQFDWSHSTMLSQRPTKSSAYKLVAEIATAQKYLHWQILLLIMDYGSHYSYIGMCDHLSAPSFSRSESTSLITLPKPCKTNSQQHYHHMICLIILSHQSTVSLTSATVANNDHTTSSNIHKCYLSYTALLLPYAAESTDRCSAPSSIPDGALATVGQPSCRLWKDSYANLYLITYPAFPPCQTNPVPYPTPKACFLHMILYATQIPFIYLV
jgi:hypothetical protein